MPQPLTDANRASILAAILAALQGVTSPALTVVEGPPWQLLQDKETHFWYVASVPTDEGSGLLDQSYIETFTVAVYWRMPANGAAFTIQLGEAWNASRNITAALRGHSTLGTLVENMHIGSATAGVWTHFSGTVWYALEIPVELVCYGAEAVGA